MMLFRLLKALDQDKYDISLITLKSGGALEKEFLDLGITINISRNELFCGDD